MKNSVFKSIKKLFKFTKDDFYLTLSPVDNADKNNIYYNSFKQALDKDCKLIAFTGPYGVGKTSIINSIFKKKPFCKKKIIRISLGNYKASDEKVESGVGVNISKEIELKILQQIVYTSYSNELPMSRFKRIKYFSKFSDALICLESLLILIYSWIFVPKLHGQLFTQISKYFPDNNGLFWILLFTYIILFILIRFVLYSIKMTIDKVSLNYKNLEITFNNKDSGSVFNKYLDEIVYFFEKTKTEIVVIEDLDRYDDVSMEVFKSLKELNFMLNANKNIKNNIVFLYAIRDDLFSTSEDRVKFFDTIIPVVSTFSMQNCKEYLLNNYKKLNEIYNLKIDEKLFDILSLFIKDRRILVNIFMEFKMYIDILKNHQEVDDTRLFALIAYKNIQPNDFDKRLKNEGDLFNIFQLKKVIIDFLTSKIRLENDEIKDEIKNMESQRLKDEKLLKKSFLFDAFKNGSRGASYYNFLLDDNNISINQLIDDIDIKLLLEGKIKYKEPGYYSNVYDFDTNLLKKYQDEYAKIRYDFDSQNKKIISNNKQIEKYPEKSIQDLLNISGVIEYLSKIEDSKAIIIENKLLLLLVKNGFIREDYEMILLYFISGELSNNDYKFLIMLGLEENIPFTYDLNNTKKVIVKIEEREFQKEKILNFKICDEVLKNDYLKKSQNFLKQFKNINDNKLKFLDDYYGYNKNNFIILMKLILDDNLILYYFDHLNDLKFSKECIKLIIENIKLDLNDQVKKQIKLYLEDNPEFFNEIILNEISKYNITLLKPLYNNYGNMKTDMIEFLYDAGIYTSNKSMFDKLYNLYNRNNDYTPKNILTFLIEKIKPFFKKLVDSHTFIEFYNQFPTCKNNEQIIINVLNNFDLSLDEEKMILTKESNICIKDIDTIRDARLWSFLSQNNLVEANMSNILSYYAFDEELSPTVVGLLEKIGDKYEVVESKDFTSLENDLLYTEEKYSFNYDKIAEVFTDEIISFDSDRKINTKLVNSLIENNKIKLTEENYNYLYSKYKGLLAKLIEKRFNEYLQILDNVGFDSNVLENSMKSNMDINNKKKVFARIDFDCFTNETNNKIVDEIIAKSVELEDEVVDKIFKALRIDYKIKYFIYLYDNDESNIKFLYKMNGKISKIRDGSSTLQSLDKNDYYVELVEYLKVKNIINGFSYRNDKIFISYSRKKLIE